jgi:hypothetical protein
MTIRSAMTFQDRLEQMFESAREYFEMISAEQEEPRYHLISDEYVAGLERLLSLVGEEDRLTTFHDLSDVRVALERYRGVLGDDFPFKRRQVEEVLKEIEHQEYHLLVPDEVP